jgi:hypothetical protein
MFRSGFGLVLRGECVGAKDVLGAGEMSKLFGVSRLRRLSQAIGQLAPAHCTLSSSSFQRLPPLETQASRRHLSNYTPTRQPICAYHLQRASLSAALPFSTRKDTLNCASSCPCNLRRVRGSLLRGRLHHCTPPIRSSQDTLQARVLHTQTRQSLRHGRAHGDAA